MFVNANKITPLLFYMVGLFGLKSEALQVSPPPLCNLILNVELARYMVLQNSVQRGSAPMDCMRARLYMQKKMPLVSIPIMKWEQSAMGTQFSGSGVSWPSMWVLKIVRPDIQPHWVEYIRNLGVAISNIEFLSSLFGTSNLSAHFHKQIGKTEPHVRYMDWQGQFLLAPVGAEIVVHREHSYALFRLK